MCHTFMVTGCWQDPHDIYQLMLGRVIQSIKTKRFLIGVVIRNQDVKKLRKQHVSA